jgi:preprotein translocase subunit SecB
MVVAPIQTRSLIYRRVEVRPFLDDAGQLVEGLRAPEFDWSEVNLGVESEIGLRAGQEENPVDFVLSLRLQITNEKGKPSPYVIDLQAVAYFEVSEGLPAQKREDLVIANGSAIVYSSLREMVLMITSRMEYGSLVLPGVHFQDQLSSNRKSSSGPPDSSK